jgi:hypothetical protein
MHVTRIGVPVMFLVLYSVFGNDWAWSFVPIPEVEAFNYFFGRLFWAILYSLAIHFIALLTWAACNGHFKNRYLMNMAMVMLMGWTEIAMYIVIVPAGKRTEESALEDVFYHVVIYYLIATFIVLRGLRVGPVADNGDTKEATE